LEVLSKKTQELIKSRVDSFFSALQESFPKKLVAEVAELITKGESPHWQGFGYVDEGIQFLTSENVLDGEISFAPVKYITNEFHAKLSRSIIVPGDVLINIVGASIGRACAVPDTIAEANTNQAVAIVRLKKMLVHPEFFLHHFRWPPFQRKFLGQQVNTARANISLTNIREAEMLVPTLEEQMVLVRECREFQSSCKNAEERREQVHQLKKLFLSQMSYESSHVH
jgi:restriction endonuclease S subunit